MTGARTSCRHKAKHTEFGLYGGVYDLCDKCRLDLPNHSKNTKEMIMVCGEQKHILNVMKN